jgi:hypothetical protein
MTGRVNHGPRLLRGGLSSVERSALEGSFAQLLRSASRDLGPEPAPLEAELWASGLWGTWDRSQLIGMDAVAVFAGGFIRFAAERGTPAAMVVLRALASVAPEPYRGRAARACAQLAAKKVREPAWAQLVGKSVPTEAWLVYDPTDDDGVDVFVGFAGPAGPETVGVYIDHNLGGMAKDVLAVPAEAGQVIDQLRVNAVGPKYRRIDLGEAAARWKAAIEITDTALDPPVDDDVHALRALVQSRLSKLPAGGTMPAPAKIDGYEQERLLESFLASDEVADLRSGPGFADRSSVVGHIALHLLTFSVDCVEGAPLRFSPPMVELFCLDWAPRKMAVDDGTFALVPDVLAAWIRFVGHRRGIREEAIGLAVEATYLYAPEMKRLAKDPSSWGPAKIMVLAVQNRGIDITDQAAMDEFIDEVNHNGGIDVLASSLAGSLASLRAAP